MIARLDSFWAHAFEASSDDSPGGREKKLLSAMLLMALKDAIDPVGLSPEEIEQTWGWFEYPGNEPWTLAWICSHLDIDVARVHKALVDRPVWLLRSKEGEQEKGERGYVKWAKRDRKDRPRRDIKHEYYWQKNIRD